MNIKNETIVLAQRNTKEPRARKQKVARGNRVAHFGPTGPAQLGRPNWEGQDGQQQYGKLANEICKGCARRAVAGARIHTPRACSTGGQISRRKASLIAPFPYYVYAVEQGGRKEWRFLYGRWENCWVSAPFSRRDAVADFPRREFSDRLHKVYYLNRFIV